jgi:hypothetical protein
MLYKRIQLFEDSQIKKRISAEQSDFVENHHELLLYSFDVFNKALEMMLKERTSYPIRYRGKNWAATTLNGFVLGLIQDKYPSEMKSDNGSYLFLGNRAIIKFKKLNDDYLPDNIATKKVTLERTQRAFSNEIDWPIVYVGYKLNVSQNLMTGYYAVCIDSWNHIQWITDIEDLYYNNSQSAPVVNITPPPQPIDLNLVRVKEGKQRRVNE